MNKFIVAMFLVFGSTSAFAGVDDFEKQMVQFDQQWDNCSTRSECSKVSFQINGFINHPARQNDLLACYQDADCYEVAYGLTMKLMLELHKITG